MPNSQVKEMSESFRVVFNGEIAEGFNQSDVQKKLSSILNEDELKVEKLFSGQSYIIKKNADRETCDKISQAFLLAGAVCTVMADDTPSSKPRTTSTDTITEENTDDSIFEADHPPSPKREKINIPGTVDTIRLKVSDIVAASQDTFSKAKEKTETVWKEGTESVSSDHEIGGMAYVVKNKYFLAVSTVLVTFLLLLFFTVSYERKSMPLTIENISVLNSHITFIENAFTIPELKKMTQNPTDFMDYLLVDPISKMGYEFNASIQDIADDFLDGDFNQKELQKLKPYLQITVQEREKLAELGFISEPVKKSLDKIQKKINTK